MEKKYLALLLFCFSLCANADITPLPGSICAIQLQQITLLTADFGVLKVYEIVAAQHGFHNGDRIKDDLTQYKVLHSQTLISADILKCMIDSIEMEAS